MQFTELIEHGKNRRFRYLPVAEVSEGVVREHEAYQSMFPVSETILQSVKVHKTNSNYEGVFYCNWVLFDIDDEKDKQNALRQAQILVERLMSRYGVKKEEMRYYFSGNKGFHIVIDAGYFGGFEPSKELPRYIKAMVYKMAENLPTFDSPIYHAHRFIRLANSLHPKTELWKVELTFNEIMEYELSEILAIAREPRPELTNEYIRPAHFYTNPKLKAVWNLASTGQLSNTGKTKRRQPLKIEGGVLANYGNLLGGLTSTTPIEQIQIAMPTKPPETEAELFELAVAFLEGKSPVRDYFTNGRNNYMTQLAYLCNDFGIGEKGDGNRAMDLITQFCSTFDPKTQPWDLKNIEQSIFGVYKREQNHFRGGDRYRAAISHMEQRNYQAEVNIIAEAQALSRVNMHPKKKLKFLHLLNQEQEVPISPERVQKIFVDYNRMKSMRKEDDIGKTMSQLAPLWVESVLRRKTSKGIGLKPIDEAMDYNYESTVVGIIGKGGTKKSLLLLKMLGTMATNGERALYSSMESEDLEQFQRDLNGSLAPQIKTTLGDNIGDVTQYEQAEIYLQRKVKELKTEEEKLAFVTMLQKVFDEKYGDNLIIDDHTGMSEDEYDTLLNKNAEVRGKIKGLGIDGLSMMAYKDELTGAVENSKAAKQIAKRHKIMVALLIHVPKAAGRDTRWLYDHTRGGSKVLENVDIAISLSEIYMPNPEGGERKPYNNYIYVAAWLKRRRGQRIEFILEMNPVTLDLTVSDKTLEELEGGQAMEYMEILDAENGEYPTLPMGVTGDPAHMNDAPPPPPVDMFQALHAIAKGNDLKVVVPPPENDLPPPPPVVSTQPIPVIKEDEPPTSIADGSGFEDGDDNPNKINLPKGMKEDDIPF